MTDESSGPNVLKLSVFLVIVLHGPSVNAVEADAPLANATGYRVSVPPEAFSSTPITATRRVQTDATVQRSSSDYDTAAAVNLVEAPVEVIGPRVVESAIPGKIERKRESGIDTGIETGPRDLRHDGGRRRARVLRDDGELTEGTHKVYNGKTGDDVTGIVRASAKRDARSRASDGGGYNNDESSSLRTLDDEDEDHEGDDDDDDDDDDDNDLALEDDKVRRSPIRKAGRYYRQGLKIWDEWGKWTSCSVSCGAGKLTRWRHCVAGGCSLGEKEAQLKTCTFSAC